MDALSPAALSSGRWTRIERMRLSAICGVVGLLHLLGVALYLHARGDVAAAGGLAGAGTLAGTRAPWGVIRIVVTPPSASFVSTRHLA